MAITQAQIAQTIVKLQQAGKRMPQDMRPGFDRLEEAKRILSETVNLWDSIFNAQNIGVERWQRAETIALTLSGAQGLNVNVISPALMQEALKQAETEHVQANINRNNAYKRESWNVPLETRINAQLWAWTSKKRAERREVMPYMPQEKDIAAYGKQLGLDDNAIRRERMLLRCFLNDWNYSQKHKKPMTSKLLLDKVKQQVTLEVQEVC